MLSPSPCHPPHRYCCWSNCTNTSTYHHGPSHKPTRTTHAEGLHHALKQLQVRVRTQCLSHRNATRFADVVVGQTGPAPFVITPRVQPTSTTNHTEALSSLSSCPMRSRSPQHLPRRYCCCSSCTSTVIRHHPPHNRTSSLSHAPKHLQAQIGTQCLAHRYTTRLANDIGLQAAPTLSHVMKPTHNTIHQLHHALKHLQGRVRAQRLPYRNATSLADLVVDQTASHATSSLQLTIKYIVHAPLPATRTKVSASSSLHPMHSLSPHHLPRRCYC